LIPFQIIGLSNILFHELILIAGDLTPGISGLQDLLGSMPTASGWLSSGRQTGSSRNSSPSYDQNNQQGDTGDQSNPEDQGQDQSDPVPDTEVSKKSPSAKMAKSIKHYSPLFLNFVRNLSTL
jgi:hypothetical protein